MNKIPGVTMRSVTWNWFPVTILPIVSLLISMGVRSGGQNGELPQWKLGLRNTNFLKTWCQQLNWFNSCNDSFICRYDTYAGARFTVLISCRESVMSLQFTKTAPLPAEAGCDTGQLIILI